MASLHIQDSVNSRDVDDRVREQHDVHGFDLLLFVVSSELIVQELSQRFKVCDLLIHLGLLALASLVDEEVDEDSISLLVRHAVLNVVHREVRLELIVDHLFEFLAVFLADKSVVEDSQDLVAPKLDDLLLALVDERGGEEETLEHLRDVTHVVDVVCLLGRGQEISHALIEDGYRRSGQ